MKKRADEILAEAAKTFKERNAVYGDNWQQVGDALHALFPTGLTLSTPDDWNRAHILMLAIVKLTRYVNNWDNGGHTDSIHDAMVYAGMLEAIDEDIRERESSFNDTEVKMEGLSGFCSTCDNRVVCHRTKVCQQGIRIVGRRL